MSMQPPVPKLEDQTSPQYPEDCTENTLLSDTTGRGGDAKACAGEYGPDAPILPVRRLKMLTSDACLKNYAIFDRCEGKDTVIVHPSWSHSPLLYSLPGSYFGRDTINSGGGMQLLLEAKSTFHCSAFQSAVGLEAPFHTRAIAVDMQRKAASRNVKLMQENMHGVAPLSDIKEEESFHENTEDIDALMSSDEELISTGHSPSDASSLNCFGDFLNAHSKETAGKKRKFGYSATDEADDADSGPCKPLPDQTILSSNRSGDSVSLHGTSGNDLQDALPGIGVSSRGKQGTAVNDAVCAKGCDYELMVRSSAIFGGETGDCSKRMKLKNNVQQLRNVVPGGDGLDTAGVLGQTIEYVKCLQRKLRDLKTARGYCGQSIGQTGLW